MTDIIQRIQNGEFANAKPYYARRQNSQGYKEFQEEDARLYNTFQDACVQFAQLELSTSINEKQGTILFNYAWREGHAEGLQRVYYVLAELVEMLNAFNKVTTDGTG